MSTGGIHRLGSQVRYPGRPSFMLVGCGGGGCNTIARATEAGWALGHHVAMNTDAQHLLTTIADQKVLLGRQSTRGRGTNMDLCLGEQACREAQGELESLVVGTDIVVVLSGLGGGTGSGAAPVMAELARKQGAMAISLSTLPFSVEGTTRGDNAEVGAANLARSSDLSMVLPNDHLLESSPSLSLLEAFRAADEALIEPVRLLRSVLTLDDLPRLRTALCGTGAAHLGRGVSSVRRGYGKVLDDALARIYPPVDIRTCDRAMVLFQAGSEEPGEARLLEMVRSLHLAMAEGARTLWGVVRDPDAPEVLTVVVMLASTR